MRRPLQLVFALLLLSASAARADETNPPAAAEPKPVKGFRLPEYDTDGNLIRQMQGDTATFMKDGIIQVTDLGFDFYSDGRPVLRVTSPFAAYDQPNARAASQNSIRIVAEKLVITGNSFAWNGEAEQFQIFDNVRVTLDSQTDTEALLNPAPAGEAGATTEEPE